MNIERLEQRQAVGAWRDELQLAAWRLINGAAKGAREGLEVHIAKDASILDTIWDPASFTYEKIDAPMKAVLSGALDGLFRQAAEELRMIAPDYAPLAEALIASAASFTFPAVEAKSAGPDAQRDETGAATKGPASPPASAGSDGSRWASVGSYVANNRVASGAREWGAWLLDTVSTTADAASQKLQSGVGLHDRLRNSASERIAIAWMGERGEPRPLMSQVVALVDEVANDARSMSL
ncbi:hypothetical protein B2G71_23095 [Novosphingobium sp. PC22D]|uniref:hypothetical protein n=1 Tax=Novosphingobium sp. PC22D TaxID=1962403 RepID=UPI000BF0CB3E|nr:hypothetical protein [Novosphingobium sp. PC22D]PEQ10303.1 hypothetical protein B2G71_23095 [Novosphingobium sp. PC22D]